MTDTIININIIIISSSSSSSNYKYQTHCTGEIKLHVAQTVNTEQLQHCVPCKHGLFQVRNCKYRAYR